MRLRLGWRGAKALGVIMAITLNLGFATPTGSDAGDTDRLFQDTNKQRVLNDLPPLRENSRLDKVASRRAGQLAAAGRLTHCVIIADPDRARCDQSAALFGGHGQQYAALHLYQPWGTWEEILYYGSDGYAPLAIAAWRDSPEHSRLMRSKAVTDLGVGVAWDDKGGVYAVEEYD